MKTMLDRHRVAKFCCVVKKTTSADYQSEFRFGRFVSVLLTFLILISYIIDPFFADLGFDSGHFPCANRR